MNMTVKELRDILNEWIADGREDAKVMVQIDDGYSCTISHTYRTDNIVVVHAGAIIGKHDYEVKR